MVSLSVGLATSLAGLGVYLYLKYPWLKYDFKYVWRIIAMIFKALKRRNHQYVDFFETQVRRVPEKTFLIYQDNHYSYQFMDRQCNKAARVAQKIGVKKQDIVAMLMHNEPAFIWTFFGLGKIGAQAALINYNLRSQSLLHCLIISDAKILVTGYDDGLIDAVTEIYPELKKAGFTIYVQGHGQHSLPQEFLSFDKLFQEASDAAIDPNVRSGIANLDICCYINTSGTTGLPKAAIVTHHKAKAGGFLMAIAGVMADDVIYTPLPLYHSAASLIALSIVVNVGATLVLGRKFSASGYWDVCHKHNVTVIQYIGELARYLLAQPVKANDAENSVRVAVGNGLRADVWQPFKKRFGIEIINEFYAATEGNLGIFNILNKDGSIGRASPLLQVFLPLYTVKFDNAKQEPVRDEKGFCILADFGEPGLGVSKISKLTAFQGYKGNDDLTNKKIMKDVFKKGDEYFNTGDLFVFDKDYFVYFHDRVGDTFRWKGENVSTIEVANVACSLPWVEDCNVYGVTIPGQDGRAGMAAITLPTDYEINDSSLPELYKKCASLLPSYAQPKFLRIVAQMRITSTLKQQKFQMVEEGFDPERCQGDRLYCADIPNQTFLPLTQERYEEVCQGKIRY